MLLFFVIALSGLHLCCVTCWHVFWHGIVLHPPFMCAIFRGFTVFEYLDVNESIPCDNSMFFKLSIGIQLDVLDHDCISSYILL